MILATALIRSIYEVEICELYLSNTHIITSHKIYTQICFSFLCSYIINYYYSYGLFTNILQGCFTDTPAILWLPQEPVENYIMAGHAIVVVKDITLLFYHGNAVILTLW